MGKNVGHIQHIKSNMVVEIDGVKSPKLPNPSALTEGELAINYAKDYETISLKNESGDVVTFSSDKKFYTKDEIDDTERATSAALNELNRRKLDATAYTPTDLSNYYQKSETSGATELSTAFGAIDTKVGSGFTSSSITEVIISNERIVATALNDLNENKLDASAYTPTDLSNYYTKSETSGATELSDAFNAIDALVGSGYTSSSITEVMIENERIIVEALTDLNTTIEEDERVTAEALNDLNTTIEENERVTAEALNDINSRISGITGEYYTKQEIDETEETISAALNYLKETIEDDELVTAEALNDLNTTIEENERVTAEALTDLDERKLDASAYTPSVGLWESGTGENSVILKGSSGTASGDYSVAEGYLTKASGQSSHAEGSYTVASGNSSHAEGIGTQANGNHSHAEGNSTKAIGNDSHAEGYNTTASGNYSHAEGYSTSATSQYSHSEGYNTKANGSYSHAEGDSTSATSQSSHAEGYYTTASGDYGSHAEGYYTKANGNYSHAEGNWTSATSQSSHAEGASTVASGYSSHAEGYHTSAMTSYSHAEGSNTKASGYYSHAEGSNTIANNQSEHASGQYNISHSATITFGNSGNTLFSVGNGDYNVRHNAFEIMQNGDIYITSGSSDIKLQDYIGGGGSITVDQVIDSGTSASTNAVSTSAVYGFVTSYTPSITVDQDFSNTASTNPISTKAVYSAITDNELVWTNAYVTLSGTVSAHTENTEIHVTAADKTAWNAKVDASAIADFFDDAKYEDSGTTKVINFYHGNTIKATIDASDFIIDGMVESVSAGTSGSTTVLDIKWNTAAGGQETILDIGDIFEADNYYTKTEVDARDLWVSGTGENAIVQKDGGNTASGKLSVAMGSGTTASGDYSYAEGYDTTAGGDWCSHAEGYNTIASGQSSHAEGEGTTASGDYGSHAEGDSTTASGISSHAEGLNTKANGNYGSHAEGQDTNAIGSRSHAEGYSTIANNQSEHASGQFNVSNSATTEFGDSGNTLFSVGNGRYDYPTDTEIRHNAFEIRQNGDIYITSGGTVSSESIKLQDYIGADLSNYYDKDEIDDLVGSGFTSSSITDVIIENEEIVSAALADLDERKLDASAYTPTDLSNYYTKSETSGATEISNALGAKVNSSTYTGHTADTTVHFTTGAVQTQIDNSISGKVNTSDIVTAITPSNSGSTDPIATKVVAENELTVTNALTDLSTNKADKSTTYTKTEIDDMIGDIETLLAAI